MSKNFRIQDEFQSMETSHLDYMTFLWPLLKEMEVSILDPQRKLHNEKFIFYSVFYKLTMCVTLCMYLNLEVIIL